MNETLGLSHSCAKLQPLTALPRGVSCIKDGYVAPSIIRPLEIGEGIIESELRALLPELAAFRIFGIKEVGWGNRPADLSAVVSRIEDFATDSQPVQVFSDILSYIALASCGESNHGYEHLSISPHGKLAHIAAY